MGKRPIADVIFSNLGGIEEKFADDRQIRVFFHTNHAAGLRRRHTFLTILNTWISKFKDIPTDLRSHPWMLKSKPAIPSTYANGAGQEVPAFIKRSHHRSLFPDRKVRCAVIFVQLYGRI
jgi:hypothetical protein